MSSNAFARSRPKVRHQRVAKTHSCDHPRFLQLVNELARLNEIKKKQEENEGGGCSSGSGSCSSSSSSSSSTNGSSNSNADAGGGASGNGDLNNTNSFNNVTLHRQTQAIVLDYREADSSTYCPNAHSSIGGPTCCNNVPQTSNGYRSLDTNQLNSALINHHYHQRQLNHQGHNHHRHHHNHNYNQNHHHNNHSHLEEPQSLCNNTQPQHDDRCPGKSSSSSFGYPKQNLVVDQNNPDFSNINDSDLRQDENRSKRKRSANDPSAYSRKNSMPSCPTSSVSGVSKKLKSSSDNVRPLSPSFTKCPICLLDSMDRDPSFTNTCFHLFCYVCIENWTKNKATCPLCRTKFTKIIYNIKSPTNYEEKHVSPVRSRDDDEGFTAERLMFEHFPGLNRSSVANRMNNSDDVQFLFEHVNRNSDALLPQYYVNQVEPRRETLHSFNTVAASSNFASNVPHPPFTSTSYPLASNYILFQPPTTSTAITGAYPSNTSLTNINNDLGNRRTSRSGRYSYRTAYESPVVDSSSRTTRASSSSIVQSSASLERHHHNQHPHQHPYQHQNQHRSSLDMGSHRQNQRMDPNLHIQMPSHPIQNRHYNPNAYPRRYNNPQIDQLIDNLSMYRPLPDM